MPIMAVGIVGLVLQHHAEDLRGAVEIAGVERLVGGGERVLDLFFDRAGGRRRGGGAGNHLVGELAHFAFGDGAEEGIDRAAAGKGEDGRDRLDAELAGNRRGSRRY